MFSHPPYFPVFALAILFISKMKDVDERDKI
jgi:hypothetical protein